MARGIRPGLQRRLLLPVEVGSHDYRESEPEADARRDRPLLAGAWVGLQLVSILADQFAWPAGLERGITILLAFGFFIALVLAWYHGEKGRQRVRVPSS